MAKKVRYVTEDGDVLGVDRTPMGDWIVCWFCVMLDDGPGGVLGEGTDEADGDELSMWEWRMAEQAVAPFAEKRTDAGYVFATRQRAEAALVAANLALITKKPVPAWVAEATAAGWKPPRGWKP